MRRHHPLPYPIALALLAGCSGDPGTAPTDPSDGNRLAAQFEDLADQVGDSGASATASALRHAAQIVRLVGHATPVTVTVDGVTHDWLAVAEQLDYPLITCTWGDPGGGGTIPPDGGDTVSTGSAGDGTAGAMPPDSAGGGTGGGGTGGGSVPPDSAGGGTGGSPGEPECTETGTNSMRSIIAWEPEHMDEVVRMTAEPGSSEVKPGVPDVMAGLPAPTAPSASGDTAVTDTVVTGGGTYGFMGEYFKEAGGIFWTVEGTQANSREAGSGACTESHTTFDWAEFDCVTARLRFEVTMRVEGGQYEPLTGRPGPDGAEGAPDLESHEISLPATTVDGAVLKVTGWTVPTPEPGPPPEPVPPPEPGPGPDPVPPVDSSAVSPPTGR